MDAEGCKHSLSKLKCVNQTLLRLEVLFRLLKPPSGVYWRMVKVQIWGGRFVVMPTDAERADYKRELTGLEDGELQNMIAGRIADYDQWQYNAMSDELVRRTHIMLTNMTVLPV